jgi:MFS family permease
LFLFFCGVLGFCQGVGYGPIAALLAEAYPTNVRFSGAAISANSGAAFISGPASYITLWLEGFGIFFSPIYVLLVGISGLISLGLMKENNSRDLRGLMSNTVGKNVPRISNPTNLEISDTPVEHD